MRASGLGFICVGLAQQQVDFDPPKGRAIVRATIRIHHASVHAMKCTHHADSGLVQQIRRLRTLRCARVASVSSVGLAQQQVDFDPPKGRAIVRATIRIHHASKTTCIKTLPLSI
ncbi:hypothetical protein BC826DRAFT_1108148 [Russula brevipes]|nr:hypothetical protein BC826DRAFT_1108148 [Russula brevipes]